MLILKGKVVTIYRFESRSGKKYVRVGIAGGGDYNQVNMRDNGKGYKEGEEVELKCVLIGENLWLQN